MPAFALRRAPVLKLPAVPSFWSGGPDLPVKRGAFLLCGELVGKFRPALKGYGAALCTAQARARRAPVTAKLALAVL